MTEWDLDRSNMSDVARAKAITETAPRATIARLFIVELRSIDTQGRLMPENPSLEYRR